jgi:hypothetical protein
MVGGVWLFLHCTKSDWHCARLEEAVFFSAKHELNFAATVGDDSGRNPLALAFLSLLKHLYLLVSLEYSPISKSTTLGHFIGLG